LTKQKLRQRVEGRVMLVLSLISPAIKSNSAGSY
jgi:hypothetical protein